ncbi:hypothetical protein ACFW1M_17155 [Streptomyces inhibens]|uniref:AbiJ-related protein n=1 Tax=Streptomyces inhibens TaxID=2293571 RepID=UPI0036BBA134
MTPRDTSPAQGTSQKITAVTRRDIFDFLRSAEGGWWGRLEEVTFLESLYDLDALPSTDSRRPTARGDIIQHRVSNFDWEDDWVFEDARFQLREGPDEFLLAFLARTVHPAVLADTDQSARRVDELNRLLAPDGWALRAHAFLSGRPVYTPVPENTGGPLIALPLRDDDASKLDLVLGQTYHLLDEDGEGLARDLVRSAKLTLRRDGGIFHPMSNDNWTADTYEAVITADRALVPEFTTAVTDVIWQRLATVLKRLEREDVQSLVVEAALRPFPGITQDWRHQDTDPLTPTNQARRERKSNEVYPTADDLVFASRAELAVYHVLQELQRERPTQNGMAILPLASAKLRDAGVRSPDFTVLGNGRAVIIEVDGPHHYGRTRKADDEDRDRHWARCGIHTIRIAHEHTSDPASVKERLREDLTRTLFPPR